MTDTAAFLPGLEPAMPDATRMEHAALRQLQDLDAQGLLTDAHAVTVQAIRDLCRVMGMSALRGRAAGMALAAKELREYLAMLPVPPTAGDPFDEFAAKLHELSGQAS